MWCECFKLVVVVQVEVQVQMQLQVQVHEGVLTTSVGVKPTSELALQLQGYLASFGIFRTSF